MDPILVAADAGDLAVFHAIPEAEFPKKLRMKDEDKRSVLHHACAAGHLDVTTFLISKGADVNHADDGDWTPLHSCTSKGDLSTVEVLLESKADVDAVTSSKASALHLAASKGHADVLQALLASGANKNARDRSNGTPLLRAAAAGRVETTRLLLDASVDVTARDGAGDNAMHVAVNGQHVAICELLMGLEKAEALMTRENEDGKTPAHLVAEMVPIELRDTLKAIWHDKTQGGS